MSAPTPELSTLLRTERLRGLAALALPGRPIVDVACDHGLLATALVASGLVPRAVASDLRTEPLQGARANASRLAVQDRVDIRLGDGLLTITPEDSCATAFIAGVGGATAADILDAVDLHALGIQRVVLQVPQAAAHLRGYLRRRTLPISKDLVLVELDRFYTTLVCDLDDPADPLPYSALELLIGRMPPARDSPARRALMTRHAARLSARIEGLSLARDPDPDELERVRSLLASLQRPL